MSRCQACAPLPYPPYPFQILVWHEIVNDTLGGRAVGVAYCPLCNSGLVFDRMDRRTLEFGTSGKLWER